VAYKQDYAWTSEPTVLRNPLLADEFEYRTWTLGDDRPPLVEPFDPARLRCQVSCDRVLQLEGESLQSLRLSTSPHDATSKTPSTQPWILHATSLTTSPDGRYLAHSVAPRTIEQRAAVSHRLCFVYGGSPPPGATSAPSDLCS
jgi:hypothetical protein